MRVLVTGIAGFMGSYIADKCVERTDEVWGCDNFEGGFMRNIPQDVVEKGHFLEMELTDSKAVDEFIDKVKPDVIHHLACYPYEGLSQFCPVSVADSVYKASLNVFRAAVNSNVGKVVYYSSMARYGRGLPPFREEMPRAAVDVYGAAKVATEVSLEAIAEATGLRYTIIVPHNVSGPRMRLDDPFRGVLGIWVNCLMKGKPFYIYGDGSSMRAFSHVNDILDPCIRAGIDKAVDGEIINIGSATPITLRDAADAIIKEFGGGQKPVHVADRPCEVQKAYCNVEKSKKILGFKDEKSFEDICKDLIKYAREMGVQEFDYSKEFEIMKGLPEVWRHKSI